MTWPLIVIALVGLPLLTLLADLNHRQLARTTAPAKQALRRADRDR
jgi:hypothetical protein